MPTSTWKKVALSIIGAIVLGAIGSGLWELGIRPGGYWFWHAVLTVATLGSKFLKDNVYLEAAKGNHEAVASHISTVVALFLGMFTGAISFTGFHLLKRRKNPEEAEVERAKSLSERARKMRGVLLLLLVIVLLTNYFVGLLKVEVANDAYTFFQQSLAICRPFITEHDAQVLQSRFAGIRGRDDFIVITENLKAIASAHGQHLPDYKPW